MGNLRKKGREDMGFWELVVLAVGLSMDAFAVSICKGLALQRVSWKECCIAGAWFGGFQALMPLLGYLLGTQFEQFVTSVDHWIAFVLLGIIGGNMIREALSKDEDKLDGSLAFKTMLLLAIATSIDALAVGITFAFLPGTRIVPAVALIGTITFAFSAAGIRRQRGRPALQAQGRVCRRRDPHPARHEDPARTPRHFVKTSFFSATRPGSRSFFTLCALRDKFSHPREYVEPAAKNRQIANEENGNSAQQSLSYLLQKDGFLALVKEIFCFSCDFVKFKI